MIKVSDKKRDIQDTIWSVLTSFGYCEVENNEGFFEEAKKEKGKYCYFDKNIIGAVNSGKMTPEARAEAAAMCIEAAVAAGVDGFSAVIFDEEAEELLELFGLEEIIETGTGKNGFLLEKADVEFAWGKWENGISEITFDVQKLMDVLIMSGMDMSPLSLSASMIFAEKNAEGVAYEVAYNLRINGCIVEYYTEGGDIDAACEYAKSKGISCIIRAFCEGKLLIKDFVKEEITETSLADFLGYYDDEEECDCGCGHEHHHGENCGCH